MSKWTKEPWRISERMNLSRMSVIGSSEKHRIGHIFDIVDSMNGDENALRIVQCVNALSGIEDPEGTIREIVAALEHSELCLKEFVEFADKDRWKLTYAMIQDVLEKIRRNSCPNCKGTGVYTGVYIAEDLGQSECPACGGSGMQSHDR